MSNTNNTPVILSPEKWLSEKKLNLPSPSFICQLMKDYGLYYHQAMQSSPAPVPESEEVMSPEEYIRSQPAIYTVNEKMLGYADYVSSIRLKGIKLPDDVARLDFAYNEFIDELRFQPRDRDVFTAGWEAHEKETKRLNGITLKEEESQSKNWPNQNVLFATFCGGAIFVAWVAVAIILFVKL